MRAINFLDIAFVTFRNCMRNRTIGKCKNN